MKVINKFSIHARHGATPMGVIVELSVRFLTSLLRGSFGWLFLPFFKFLFCSSFLDLSLLWKCPMIASVHFFHRYNCGLHTCLDALHPTSHVRCSHQSSFINQQFSTRNRRPRLPRILKFSCSHVSWVTCLCFVWSKLKNPVPKYIYIIYQETYWTIIVMFLQHSRFCEQARWFWPWKQCNHLFSEWSLYWYRITSPSQARTEAMTLIQYKVSMSVPYFPFPQGERDCMRVGWCTDAVDV